MIYHNSYWLILYQIDFGKFLSDWYFIRSIIGKFISIDILSDQNCWKIIEKVVFLTILLVLTHILGVGFIQFQHLQRFKASNSEISFQFISDDNLSDWSLANSFQIDIWSDRCFANYFWLIFFPIKNVGISTKRLAKR